MASKDDASERSERATGAERGSGVPASDGVGEFEGRSPSIKEEGRCSIQLSYGRTNADCNKHGQRAE